MDSRKQSQSDHKFQGWVHGDSKKQHNLHRKLCFSYEPILIFLNKEKYLPIILFNASNGVIFEVTLDAAETDMMIF